MTDHPFDEIAVEAHARSLCEREFPKRDWNTTVGPALKAEFINQSKTALTAACNSMKERGKATQGSHSSFPNDGGGATNMGSVEFWKTDFDFTIFRHGE